jgi:hypothetical protein
LKKIVILKGALIDSLEEFVLRECLEIMFPECKIEIRTDANASRPDEKMHTRSDKKKVAN